MVLKKYYDTDVYNKDYKNYSITIYNTDIHTKDYKNYSIKIYNRKNNFTVSIFPQNDLGIKLGVSFSIDTDHCDYIDILEDVFNYLLEKDEQYFSEFLLENTFTSIMNLREFNTNTIIESFFNNGLILGDLWNG